MRPPMPRTTVAGAPLAHLVSGCGAAKHECPFGDAGRRGNFEEVRLERMFEMCRETGYNVEVITRRALSSMGSFISR